MFWVVELVDDAPIIIYVSPAYEDILGLPIDELVADSQNWRRILHPDDRERVAVSRGRMAEAPTEQDFRIIRPDGRTRWIRDRTFPILDEAGHVYRVAGVAEDVTDRWRRHSTSTSSTPAPMPGSTTRSVPGSKRSLPPRRGSSSSGSPRRPS